MDKIKEVRLWGDLLEKNPDTSLIIIGGAEDKEHDKEILKYIVSLVDVSKDQIVVATVASEEPKKAREKYNKVFKELGVANLKTLNIDKRLDAFDQKNIELIKTADLIFFTGGDQLRITSILGGTPIYDEMKRASKRECYFVGTSAGASVMSTTMIIGGKDEDSPRKCTIKMAPGLGLIDEVIIDQHFSQRGRIGRLLAAVAQNPQILGIGIDEDTAIVVNKENKLKVIGNGSVYIVDGSEITYSNVSEQFSDEILSMYNVKVHVLTKNKMFDLTAKVHFEEAKEKNESNK